MAGQKAWSTIRCIKTTPLVTTRVMRNMTSQKARSAIRCIKTKPFSFLLTTFDRQSASAERHKVH